MHEYNYTVEDSKLYIILPVSFNNTNYIVELTANSKGVFVCGTRIISANKIIVLYIDFIDGKAYYRYDPSFKANIFALGF